jgi:hypothetical protein
MSVSSGIESSNLLSVDLLNFRRETASDLFRPEKLVIRSPKVVGVSTRSILFDTGSLFCRPCLSWITG